MDDSIRIRSGDLGGRTEMPKLKYAEIRDGKKFGSEIAYRTDEKALYIGTENGNVRLCGAEDEARIKSLEEKPDYYSKAEIDALIESITARLDALTPSE